MEKGAIELDMWTMDPLLADKLPADINRSQGWGWVPNPVLDDWLRDGPRTRRLIVQYDKHSGYNFKKVKVKKNGGTKAFRYNNKKISHTQPNAFRCLSVFTIAMRTLDMFERADTLGRGVVFQFVDESLTKGQPLKIMIGGKGGSLAPHYKRFSKSITLPLVTNCKTKETVWSSDSPDIVAHEMTHAVVDGLLPLLYGSKYAQAIAIHESLADLGAFILSMQMNDLRDTLLDMVNYKLEDANALVNIAEEYGKVTSSADENRHYLRSVNTDQTMKSIADEGLGSEPYELSAVISGLVFELICDDYLYSAQRSRDKEKEQGKEERSDEYYKRAGIRIASWKLRRIIFRSLEYVVPGDIGFVDLIAAIYLADEMAYQGSDVAKLRNQILARAKQRHIIADEADIRALEIDKSLFKKVPLHRTFDTDQSVEDFIGSNRTAIGIPTRASIVFIDCVHAKKNYWKTNDKGENVSTEVGEVIVKIAWQKQEDIFPEEHGRTRNEVTCGATLVFARDSGEIKLAIRTSGKLGDRLKESGGSSDKALCKSLTLAR